MNNKSKKLKIIAITTIAVLFFIAVRLFFATVYAFPILMYHGIDKNPGNSKLTVSVQDFAAQMNFLKRHEFKVLPLDEVVGLVKSHKSLPKKAVAITIDDGYENNYVYAYPVLKKNNFPATIFVIAGAVGKSGFLPVTELKEMLGNKIDIGSHSFTHPWLPELKEDALVKEIFDSKAALEKLLDKKVNFFCYPAGGFNAKVEAMVKAAGYLGACTTNPGRRFSNRDIFALKRVRISGGNARIRDNLLVFRIKISGYYLGTKKYWKKD